MRLGGLIILTGLLVVGGGSLGAADQGAGELLKLVPDTVNAVVVVRAKDLEGSPRGQREGWAKKHETEFLAGSISIPPNIDTLVRGISFHLEDSHNSILYSVASWQRMTSIAEIAKREGTEVEWIGPVPTARTSRNALVAEIVPGITGLIRPGFRQEMARWIERCEQKGNAPISAYLAESLKDEAPQIVMAFDTRDMFDLKRVTTRLAHMESMAGIAAHFDALSKLIQQMRGIRMQVTVTDKTAARLSLDFAADVPKGLGVYFKPLLSEFLGDAGAYIDELETAKVEVATRSVTLVMDLSDVSLRRVLSLMAAPSPSVGDSQAIASPPSPDTTAPSSSQQSRANAAACQAYFSAVYQCLADLEAMNRKAKDYNKTASWHDTFAKKIDQLPMRGVDQELLDYGADVASKLRSLSASLRGVPLTMNRLQNSITYDVHYDPGWVAGSWWGAAGYRPSTTNVQTNAGQIRAEQAAAVAKGAEQREEVWQMLADDTAKIRRKMLEKHNVELKMPETKTR